MALMFLVLFTATANFAIGFALAVYAGQGPAIDLLAVWPTILRRRPAAVGDSQQPSPGE
jgi:hypothetical protein